MIGKKERLTEIDLIKLIAMMAVFTVHYTVQMIYQGVNALAQVFPTQIFNVYLGTFGVSLFFIASGASLYYVYGQKLEPKTYFKKRFLSIYPMFWMAYLCILLFHFIIQDGLPGEVPAWKIVYTITGIDGTMQYYGPNFYQTGEWFLGVIIGIYLLFPLIRLSFNKKMVLTCAVSGIVMILFILFWVEDPLPLECVVFVRIPEFLFGMLYIKYRDRFKLWHIIPAAGIIALISFLPQEGVNVMIRNLAVGASAFTIMGILFRKIPVNRFTGLLITIGGKYSYAFFLTHHAIIVFFIRLNIGGTLTRKQVYLLYLLCLVLTAVCTKLLYMLHGRVMKFFNNRQTRALERK